jgi:hypothetical protein
MPSLSPSVLSLEHFWKALLIVRPRLGVARRSWWQIGDSELFAVRGATILRLHSHPT